MALEKLKVGDNYTFIEDVSQSAEIVAFETINLPNGDYGHKVDVVVYLDEEFNYQVMQIDKFSQSYC